MVIHVGDIIRNTSINWYGTYRQFIGTDGDWYRFRVLDQHPGYLSSVPPSVVANQFEIGRWTLWYPETVILPQGA